jgi:GTPase SAR1 family protein
VRAAAASRGKITGKSSIARRFVGQRFEEAYEPTIISSQRKVVRIEATQFDVEIIDTAGQVCRGCGLHVR